MGCDRRKGGLKSAVPDTMMHRLPPAAYNLQPFTPEQDEAIDTKRRVHEERLVQQAEADGDDTWGAQSTAWISDRVERAALGGALTQLRTVKQTLPARPALFCVSVCAARTLKRHSSIPGHAIAAAGALKSSLWPATGGKEHNIRPKLSSQLRAFERLTDLLVRGVCISHAAHDMMSAMVCMNMLNTFSLEVGPALLRSWVGFQAPS